MRSIEILRKKLSEGFGFLHARRQDALWRAVEALMAGGRLWLTALGRDMRGSALEKHRIKAADRLLGNHAIQESLVEMYRVLAAWLLRHVDRPVVLVDWTGCGPEQYMLRAGLPFGGRSILLYGCVVSRRRLASRAVHARFLKTLATILPPHCRPVIVTDAGFHHHWFEQVTRLKWDFVGRIRGAHHVRIEGEQMPLRDVFQTAGKHPRDLGFGEAGIKHVERRRLILSAKPKLKGRQRLGRRGDPRRGWGDYHHSRAARAPLLVATSLSCPPQSVVKIYASRMQVEESFRDLKSHRFGWDFSSSRSKDPRRIEMMLMIATLASVALSMLGLAAERRNLHWQFQANTTRRRRVLSVLSLGRRLLKSAIDISTHELRAALTAVRLTLEAANPLQTHAR